MSQYHSMDHNLTRQKSSGKCDSENKNSPEPGFIS